MAENRRFSILPQRNQSAQLSSALHPTHSHASAVIPNNIPYGDSRDSPNFQNQPVAHPVVQYLYLPQPPQGSQYQMAPVAYQQNPQFPSQLTPFQLQQIQQAQYMNQQNYVQPQQQPQQHQHQYQPNHPNLPNIVTRRAYLFIVFICYFNSLVSESMLNRTPLEPSATSPQGSIHSLVNSDTTSIPPPLQSIAESTYLQILETELKKKEKEIENYNLILPVAQKELKAALEDIFLLNSENEALKKETQSTSSTSHFQVELESAQSAYNNLQNLFTQEKLEIEANFHETTKVIESNHSEISALKSRLATAEAALQDATNSHNVEIEMLMVKMEGLQLNEQRGQDVERDLAVEKSANERLRRQILHLEQHSTKAREVYDQMRAIIQAKSQESERLAEEVSMLRVGTV
ncbi:hypothetical protein HK096_011374 [Nowakowskiella sp. JEL0078]|nr:hypothetical protein HK096_011374 [Nowakowskiella sp. JEL0078]